MCSSDLYHIGFNTPHTPHPTKNFLPQTLVKNCCQWAKSRF
ncbi:hypothetical protein C789_4848 [Microcystis aeruginosa FACHB-905 = DIANCHI905]|nr:hypothetical protein C789_4848 [Microcystis aeruginosa FACHB-905 = DIANCHI905]